MNCTRPFTTKVNIILVSNLVWSNINFDVCFYYCSDSDSEFDDECTLSASEILSSTQGEEDMEITYTDDCGSIEVILQYGPETR